MQGAQGVERAKFERVSLHARSAPPATREPQCGCQSPGSLRKESTMRDDNMWRWAVVVFGSSWSSPAVLICWCNGYRSTSVHLTPS